MELTMKNILDKYPDCKTFSLTTRANGYNITEEEFELAINKREIKTLLNSIKKLFLSM